MSDAFGTNWLDLSSTSNRYIQTYYRGFVDISGGPLYVRNNNLNVRGGDISLNGRLYSAGDVSLNSRLYVGSDASFNGKIFSNGLFTASGGLSVVGTINLPSNSIIDTALSTNIATLTGSQTLSNKTLTSPVISSISNSGTITIPTGTLTLATLTGTETLTNKTLTTPVISSISNSGTITIPSGTDTLATLTATQTLTNKTLTSPVISSISNSGTITIPSGTDTLATLTGTQTLTNKTLTTSGLLTALADASLNARLFVGSDVSFSGRLFLSNDASMNGNLSIAKDMSIGGNLYVYTYTTRQTITELSYQLIVAQDLSLNGRLFLSNDASINNRVFIGSDVSMGANLFISKVLKPVTISESFVTNSGTTSPYTLDYSTGSTFYITTPPATNFTVNLTNVPTDINRTYVATLIITSTTNKTFCNSLQINGNTAITPNFANGIPTSFTSGNVMTQSISIQRITLGDVAANNSVLSAVTAWY